MQELAQNHNAVGQDDRGRVLQVISAVASVFALLLLVLVLLPGDEASLATDLAILTPLLLSCGLTWLLARLGRIAAGSHVLFVTLVILALASSLEDGAASVTVPTLFLPIVGATLLLRPRWSFAYAGLALAVYVFLSVFRLEPGLDSLATLLTDVAIKITLFTAYFFIVSLLSFTAANRLLRIVAASRDANVQLAALRDDLEHQVTVRTSSLHHALQEVQEREARLAEALDSLSQSEAMIRELSAPVIPVLPGVLVLPLSGAVDTRRAETITARALQAVEDRSARYLVFDVTGVPVIDTQVAQLLLQTAAAVKLLGAEVCLVGIRPEVAQTLVALQVDVSAIQVAADLQQALLTLPGQSGVSVQRELHRHSELVAAR